MFNTDKYCRLSILLNGIDKLGRNMCMSWTIYSKENIKNVSD